MNAQRPRRHQPLVEQLRHRLGVRLRLDHRQTAKLRARAGDGVADDVARVDAQPAAVEGRLREQLRHLRVGDVRQDDVLLDSCTDLARRVRVGQVRDRPALCHRQPPGGHVHAHTRQARLGLRVHAEQLAAREVASRLGLRALDDRAATVRLRLGGDLVPESFDALLLNQPHQPRLLAVAARALVAEDAEDGLGDVDDRLDLGRHPHVPLDRVGDALDRHVPPDHDVEAHLARLRVCARLEPDVVDVRVSKVIARAGDGDVELAGQVAPLWVAARARVGVERDEVREDGAQVARVDHLLVVDPGERAADEVAHVVQRRLERRLVARVQPVGHVAGVLERDAAQLKVLARRDVDHAEVGAVRLDAVGVEAHQLGRDDAVGRAQPHHKPAWRPLAAVQQADPLEARVKVGLLDLLPGEGSGADGGGVLVHRGEGGGAVLGQLDLFDRVPRLCTLDRVRREEGEAGGLGGAHADGAAARR
mmetsp:Transcript_1309/g.4699  ORF Transcript_1309/g.4699 Transcript_1309/m.4699 type:complete len:477 (+) Transcript_1309:400-1830(+)